MSPLVDINAIAELLGCSTKTVRRKVRKGLIPVIQPDGPGTMLRFDVNDVLSFLKLPPDERLLPGKGENSDQKPKEILSGPVPRWKKRNKGNK